MNDLIKCCLIIELIMKLLSIDSYGWVDGVQE